MRNFCGKTRIHLYYLTCISTSTPRNSPRPGIWNSYIQPNTKQRAANGYLCIHRDKSIRNANNRLLTFIFRCAISIYNVIRTSNFLFLCNSSIFSFKQRSNTILLVKICMQVLQSQMPTGILHGVCRTDTLWFSVYPRERVRKCVLATLLLSIQFNRPSAPARKIKQETKLSGNAWLFHDFVCLC